MIRIGAAEPRGRASAGGSDPLAELARLIGQSDPFAEFGRSNARQRRSRHSQRRATPPTTAPDDWHDVPAPEQRLAAAADCRDAAGQGATPRRESRPDATGRSHACSDPPAGHDQAARSASRLDHDCHPAADHQRARGRCRTAQYEDERAARHDRRRQPSTITRTTSRSSRTTTRCTTTRRARVVAAASPPRSR